MATSKRRKRDKKKREKRYRARWAKSMRKSERTSSAQSKRSVALSNWAGSDGQIGACIRAELDKSLGAYRSQPNLIREHANHEEDTARGGYARRQLFELVQNSADALSGSGRGRIHIRLTPTHLYCADEGETIDPDGVKTLMFSHLSSKRGTSEIGRFGLGFKSVLGVTDTPEFFSRSGSFRFDRSRSASRLRPIDPDVERYPVLRLPEPIEPWDQGDTDPILLDIMEWAKNIVRLPLRRGSRQTLDEQIKEFPAEFLLFVEHVSELVLQTDAEEVDGAITPAEWHRQHQPGAQTDMQRGMGSSRRITLRNNDDDTWLLDDDGKTSRWVVVKEMHRLSSDAKNDSRSLDDADEIPIWWATPIERLNDPGKFWAFFPTQTTSLLAGILNAPWKTNEDRQNLLPGIYNDELIDAAADMVAKTLPQLATVEDPARHLDALPRREEAGDTEHSIRLRKQLYSKLAGREVAPDQDGRLRKLRSISYPPLEMTDDNKPSLERWAEYEHRPSNWVHYSALTRTRMPRLDRLWEAAHPANTVNKSNWYATTSASLPRASIQKWLEALRMNVDSEEACVRASMSAIQTAVLIPQSIRDRNELGSIVFTDDGKWVSLDPDSVFLGGEHAEGAKYVVHPDLEADVETLRALKEFGLQPASEETAFRELAANMLDDRRRYRDEKDETVDWSKFWNLARGIDPSAAAKIIESHKSWRDTLLVRTVAGEWSTLFHALLPGLIVPADGSRDANVAIDVSQYHQTDERLLKLLGAVDAPRGGHKLSSGWFGYGAPGGEYEHRCRKRFTDRDLPRRPDWNYLNFSEWSTTGGPLDVIEDLSDEGKVLYTWELLDLDDTYKQWTMSHDTQEIYPSMDFESPAVYVLEKHGRIRTDEGVRDLSEALGDSPNPGVLRRMLSHPRASDIRSAFGLRGVEMPVEPVGEEDPVPLLDIWPGLERYLPAKDGNFQLVRCDGFRDEEERVYFISGDFLYVVRQEDEEEELRLVLGVLERQLSDERIEKILHGPTDAQVKAARDAIRRCSTDEDRLLEAVGEAELRNRLPAGLIEILEDAQDGRPLTGAELAQAAISTFHTGALREYRRALVHLDPPRKWAGGRKAIEFVRALGFGDEWAGERNARRDPFIEVDGPYSLPELHEYQRKVVGNVRTLIQSNGALGRRRGMISMPTGSGKTRVAVQAVVESIRDQEFVGGILWVADRDELCEQAVESWRQVWASKGAHSTRLRISRMWAGQPKQFPTDDLHVIVATIQTLYTRIEKQPESYEFLANFKLLVFDEAHRSVAPTATTVMQELGLTRWRRPYEPFLIGLTATPYRGHDERETERLVNRYGSNRLDAGVFESDNPERVIQELQDMRILAQADHDTIEGGRFSLSEEEEQQAQKTPWLPRSVEDRIALNADRTRRIIEKYKEQIEDDWPTLVFATSVEHAKIVAALLTRLGTKARAVSGETETSVRRRAVEEFRSGEIKALVNYGVFREGFDAPRTRAIIVARPVYSPNLYFQMVGRGLRGVKNGGNDRCLILNVQDNIENFQRKLAFSDLDWLWA